MEPRLGIWILPALILLSLGVISNVLALSINSFIVACGIALAIYLPLVHFSMETERHHKIELKQIEHEIQQKAISERKQMNEHELALKRLEHEKELRAMAKRNELQAHAVERKRLELDAGIKVNAEKRQLQAHLLEQSKVAAEREVNSMREKKQLEAYTIQLIKVKSELELQRFQREKEKDALDIEIKKLELANEIQTKERQVQLMREKNEYQSNALRWRQIEVEREHEIRKDEKHTKRMQLQKESYVAALDSKTQLHVKALDLLEVTEETTSRESGGWIKEKAVVNTKKRTVNGDMMRQMLDALGSGHSQLALQ